MEEPEADFIEENAAEEKRDLLGALRDFITGLCHCRRSFFAVILILDIPIDRTAHSIPCSVQLASLARSGALTHSLLSSGDS